MVADFIVAGQLIGVGGGAAGGDSSSNFWSALPTILWTGFAILLLFLFLSRIKDLFASLIWRIRCGTPFKLGSLELGATYITARGEIVGAQGQIQSTKDSGSRREHERNQYYRASRGIFLVHRLVISKQPGQLYDVEIYVIPHKDATLACVGRVEYFFGHYWGNKIFTSQGRARGFAISTSAYGPFVVTAEIFFTDDTSTLAWRYIDFEMGAAGTQPLGVIGNSPDV